jgi:hypothetical protein
VKDRVNAGLEVKDKRWSVCGPNKIQ